jgi:hypothetical protein
MSEPAAGAASLRLSLRTQSSHACDDFAWTWLCHVGWSAKISQKEVATVNNVMFTKKRF